MVKAFLYDAEMQPATNRAVKIWMRNLEALAFEADNVLDEFNYQLLSKKVEATRNRTDNNPIAYRLKLGRRIKYINEKLKSINQQATEFGLQTRIASAQAPVSGLDSSASRQTDSFSEDPIFLGRENDVSRIVEKLITASQAEQKLSVLPIVGMGGQGKTMLARTVFNHEQIKSHFGDNCVWVHVPRVFDVVVLLKKILTSMAAENVEHGNREALLKILKKYLGAKKYLLVLDDVWNEDREKWDDFVKSLSGISSPMGNCMIVTTRSHKAASVVETLAVYKLESLSEDDCWSIIKAKAFNRSGEISLEFETMGKKIAKRCQGLPLAAKVVGGLLCKKSKDEWLEIEKNWLSDFGDGNTISKILKLSFDNLSSPSLKKCFAYCSIFPKGYEIKKEQLIELWMAEGFLQTDHQGNNINMETTGSNIFNLLLQNSLLQVVRSDYYGNVTHCNMHDLVHDLAFSVLCENDNVPGGICQSRYIGYNSSGDGLLSIPRGQERYVRTLFFNGKVSNITFSDFKSLRTLTLVGEEDIDDFPTSIRELKHLRYLDVSKTRIRYLPDSIGELYHLQTLRVDVSNLEKLFESLSYLISLRHLHIHDSTSLPPKIGKLTSLQTLPYFHVGSEKGCGISELGSLKNLKGKLEIHNLEKVRDKNEAMSADLLQKPGIYKLKLVWDKSREGDEANDEKLVLSDMPTLTEWAEVDLPPASEVVVFPRLEYLKIKGCRRLMRAPSHFPCLQKLKIDEMESSLPLEDVCGMKLTTLTHMIIRGVEGLKCLPDWLFSNNHNLTKLDIRNCPNMMHLVPCLRGGGAPSLLRELVIRDCRSLRELPVDLYSLNSLEELEIFWCPVLKSIPYPISSGGGHESQQQQQQQQQGFTSLCKLEIYNCEGLTNLPIEMVVSCALSLKSLILEGLSSITNLGMVIGCLHRMTRLGELVIERVPKFSIKDISSLRTNTLQSLIMGPSPPSWNNGSFNETVDAMLPQFISLRRLTLYGMEHWDCLPDQLQHLTCLEYLSLNHFGIEALPEWFGNLSSLETLILFYCKRLRHLPSKQAMQRLSNLTLLQIIGCPLLLKENKNKKKNNIERPQIDDSEWPRISHIPNVQVDYHQVSSERDGH
ncbi:putative disease resistance protein rga3 [Phtheirospermum japonicum]|uniref:Putative disease resistance protein rga3 n=1 Tax=Phtheirospermum japonicum TaxID=374723 RepID=A0A830B3L6_9LAMI|nr:putative disease resistance protein rga3 [Phtheirospermum japonicum]